MPPLLPRFLVDHQQRVEHARKLAKICRETDGNVADEKVRYRAPADGRTLRGLPAIGRSVAGAISGTNPESALMSKQPDE